MSQVDNFNCFSRSLYSGEKSTESATTGRYFRSAGQIQFEAGVWKRRRGKGHQRDSFAWRLEDACEAIRCRHSTADFRDRSSIDGIYKNCLCSSKLANRFVKRRRCCRMGSVGKNWLFKTWRNAEKNKTQKTAIECGLFFTRFTADPHFVKSNILCWRWIFWTV